MAKKKRTNDNMEPQSGSPIVRTHSGRRSFPPLSHWLGERLTSNVKGDVSYVSSCTPDDSGRKSSSFLSSKTSRKRLVKHHGSSPARKVAKKEISKKKDKPLDQKSHKASHNKNMDTNNISSRRRSVVQPSGAKASVEATRSRSRRKTANEKTDPRSKASRVNTKATKSTTQVVTETSDDENSSCERETEDTMLSLFSHSAMQSFLKTARRKKHLKKYEDPNNKKFDDNMNTSKVKPSSQIVFEPSDEDKSYSPWNTQERSLTVENKKKLANKKGKTSNKDQSAYYENTTTIYENIKQGSPKKRSVKRHFSSKDSSGRATRSNRKDEQTVKQAKKIKNPKNKASDENTSKLFNLQVLSSENEESSGKTYGGNGVLNISSPLSLMKNSRKMVSQPLVMSDNLMFAKQMQEGSGRKQRFSNNVNDSTSAKQPLDDKVIPIGTGKILMSSNESSDSDNFCMETPLLSRIPLKQRKKHAATVPSKEAETSEAQPDMSNALNEASHSSRHHVVKKRPERVTRQTRVVTRPRKVEEKIKKPAKQGPTSKKPPFKRKIFQYFDGEKGPGKNTIKRKKWIEEKLNNCDAGHSDNLFEGRKSFHLPNLFQDDDDEEEILLHKLNVFGGLTTPKVTYKLNRASPIKGYSASSCATPSDFNCNKEVANAYIYQRAKNNKVKKLTPNEKRVPKISVLTIDEAIKSCTEALSKLPNQDHNSTEESDEPSEDDEDILFLRNF